MLQEREARLEHDSALAEPGQLSGPSAAVPEANNSNHRNRLRRHWGKYAPEKDEVDIDVALRLWAGREDTMFVKLVERPGAPITSWRKVITP